MMGGETFILKMPAFRLGTFVDAFKKEGQKIKVVGKRPGEKDHESLVSDSERPYCHDHDYCYVITKEKSDEPLYIPNSYGIECLTKEQLVEMSP
jgi:FlaA1/EpsC-like NDP-sugar epimerase